MLLVDERRLQPDLVGADRIVPVASVAASRDLDASLSTQRAATCASLIFRQAQGISDDATLPRGEMFQR